MRQTQYLMVASGLVIVGATMWATGCGQLYEECLNGNLCISTHKPVDEPVCPGSPLDPNSATGKLEAFTEKCSVFVAFGPINSSADGSVASPFTSLQTAINEARGRWVIACNNAVFDEAITTKSNVKVYGGFSCTNLDWKRDEAVKTALTPSMPMANPDSNIITLTLQNGKASDDKGDLLPLTVSFQDFSIKAPSAAAPGGSSIGVVVDGAVSAEFVNCDVEAGDGQPGDNAPLEQGVGTDGSSPTKPAGSACLLPIQGGDGATTSCPDGESRGGTGGNGGDPANSGIGQPGKPSPDAMGGAGGKADDATSGGCVSGKGQDGASGSPGSPGSGGTDFGTLSLTGITGGDGTPGGDGALGRGGGGGGGRPPAVSCGGSPGHGASGGGGGSGGCGGKGGGGGQAGGSSIAIINLGPNLALTNVTLKTANGGKGGDGVNGAGGGKGGDGGLGGAGSGEAGSLLGCSGGNGGKGGDGGRGGGGRGGHSIGVVYKVAPAMPSPPTSYIPGALGERGVTFDPGTAPKTSLGIFGIATACWDVSKKMPCSP